MKSKSVGAGPARELTRRWVIGFALSAAVFVSGLAGGSSPVFTVDLDIGGLTTIRIEDGRVTGSYRVEDEQSDGGGRRMLDLELPPDVAAAVWNRLVASPPPATDRWRERDEHGRQLSMVVALGSTASLRGSEDIDELQSILRPVLEERGISGEAIFDPEASLESDPVSDTVWFDLVTVEWPPDRVRTLRRDGDTGVTYFEIVEAPPAAVDSGAVFSEWFVLPGFQQPQQPMAAITRRQIGAVTPIGAFALAFDEYAWTRSAGDGPEGPLALLVFDPDRAGPLRCPMPAVFETARAQGVLTTSQEAELAALERQLISRGYSGLLRAWSDFTKRPATPDTVERDRAEVVRALTSLVPELPAPGVFFDRSQRERLRALGHALDLPGRCRWTVHSQRLTLDLEDCPRSQVIAAWNRNLGVERVGPPAGMPRLVVAPQFEHREVTMRLEVDGLGRDAAFRVLLGALLEAGFSSLPAGASADDPVGQP